MTARQAETRSYWIGAILGVILLFAALYWWREDIGRWIGGTPSVEMEQTTSSQTDQPEAEVTPQVPQPEAPVSSTSASEAADVPASTD